MEVVERIRNYQDFNYEEDLWPVVKVYMSEETEDTKKGWKVVELSLEKLKEHTQKDGAILVVVNIADPLRISEGSLKDEFSRAGKEYSPEYPNKKLKKICNNLDIICYDMYDDAMKYISENNLKYPYLSFVCDAHYSKVGHELMANLTVKFLKENRILQ